MIPTTTGDTKEEKTVLTLTHKEVLDLASLLIRDKQHCNDIYRIGIRKR